MRLHDFAINSKRRAKNAGFVAEHRILTIARLQNARILSDTGGFRVPDAQLRFMTDLCQDAVFVSCGSVQPSLSKVLHVR